MATAASIEALIRECSTHDERLSGQLADAERDAPDRVACLVDLINRVRQLRAELVAVHPKSADALRHQISRRS
jgi:hypothetical protein